ncbi:30S ribosomal protein S2 [Candidatus Shapirobacteria bacterium CG10_big_fil_rev_8_21_14_0_10_40_9]|uniref:Small ribosomal subunit protein uS2 n=1 Tax=Candidatus Shapirobacteria bacterium CG10_big_fil_rev_8_21_14_0_10_40_9 TaxID=1974888 RepID=A0A2M8L344_9BACT|nr:MAG: 30S ribosomal protein S2 [Candidatus Shapirobacteria bacterium CG10_big_fil_rev_8_21_14_0_10_40_9]
MKKITLKELLEAGCHFGHQTVRWNPKMKPYIFEARERIHIFDLVKTKEGLEAACAFVKATASQGGKILFVGTKRQAKEIIQETAKKAGMPYVSQRWLGGTLTNFEQIQKSLEKLETLKKEKEEGKYKEYTKKENLLIDREIARLEKFFGGLTSLEKLPEALFVVDVKTEAGAVLEAARKEIPVVGIVDTNSDPDLVDYVIPGNDDAQKSIELIVGVIGDACKGKSAK